MKNTFSEERLENVFMVNVLNDVATEFYGHMKGRQLNIVRKFSYIQINIHIYMWYLST